MKDLKVEDVGDIALRRIKVRLPESVYNSSSLTEEYYNIGRDVWLFGPVMNDWFVKKDPKEDQIYPLFKEFLSWEEIKEWEVLEIAPDKKK